MQPIKLKPSRLPPDLAERLTPQPDMHPTAVALLAARLRSAACYLEYGGGGSTLLAAECGVPQVFTIESDRSFAAALQQRLARDGHAAHVHVSAVDLGATGRWGYPLTRDRMADWPSYPLDVWRMLRRHDLAPDLILIDGRFRIACFLACLLYARPGATILFDDYEDRIAHYGEIERFLKPDQLLGGAGLFTVPPERAVAALADALPVACLDMR